MQIYFRNFDIAERELMKSKHSLSSRRWNPYSVAETLWHLVVVNETSILHYGNTVLKNCNAESRKKVFWTRSRQIRIGKNVIVWHTSAFAVDYSL